MINILGLTIMTDGEYNKRVQNHLSNVCISLDRLREEERLFRKDSLTTVYNKLVDINKSKAKKQKIEDLLGLVYDKIERLDKMLSQTKTEWE